MINTYLLTQTNKLFYRIPVATIVVIMDDNNGFSGVILLFAHESTKC